MLQGARIRDTILRVCDVRVDASIDYKTILEDVPHFEARTSRIHGYSDSSSFAHIFGISFQPSPMETEGSPEDKRSVTEHPK